METLRGLGGGVNSTLGASSLDETDELTSFELSLSEDRLILILARSGNKEKKKKGEKKRK